MGRRRGEAKRIKPGSRPTKSTLYTEDVGSNNAKDEAPVRPRRGGPKRIKPGSKPTKVTLYSEETDARDCEAPANSPNAGVDGELPSCATSPRFIRSGRVGRRIRRGEASSRKLEGKQDTIGRNDVSADVHLGGRVDSGWPLQNQEIATWASSFRFELDSGRLQAMLEREAQNAGTPGGSFRFRNGPEELGNGLKTPPPAPRQIESHGLIASQEDAAENPRQDWSIVPFAACKNVAVDVPNSPERSVILQRLRELKAQAVASPRFGLEDDASYHKELAKLTVGRGDGLDQWLKASSPLRRSNIQSSSGAPVKAEQSPPRGIVTATVLTRRKPISSRENPRRTGPQSARETVSSIAPTDSRFKSNANNNDNNNNNSKENTRNSSSGSSLQEQILSIAKQSLHVTSPSPDRTHFLPASSIPFQWEDRRGKPKTIRMSRALSREATEFIKYMENLPPTEAIAVDANAATSSSSPEGRIGGDGDGARAESHRYYGRVRHSRETSLGQISSRRYSTNEKLEAQIDLDASAAAKFLVEQYDTPLSTPRRQGSSPEIAVPFKWEDAPGKAKASTPATRANLLQLPPRLAVVPSYRSSDSLGRDLRASHPFAGFFAPCMTASSPGQPQQQQRDRKQSDQLEPSKSLPPRAPSPPERRRRAGLVGRCSSLPQQGCQISVPRSAASSPVTKPTGIDPNPNSNPNVPSSPTSTLHGPDGSSSQTSASNLAFPSCDLDDFTLKTSKSSSFASTEEDFTKLPKASGTLALKTDPPRSRLRGASATSTSRNGGPGTSTSLNAPTATGARSCDPTTSSTWTLPSPGASTSRSRDDKNGSAYKPVSQGEILCASPTRPTRLPYTMPSVAEQMLASCNESTRRQLIQDLSPRLMRRYSGGRRLTRSGNTPAAAAEEACPSPAYAAALELLSPAMAQRRKARSPARVTLVAKPRRRPRFMLSIVRTLKRVVLGRQRRCKRSVEPQLMMYCDALAPTAFQFSKGSN